MKFMGFALIKLQKAVGVTEDSNTICRYNAIIHDKFGRIKELKSVKLSEIEKDFGKVRMKDKRYAILVDSETRNLTEEEYSTYLDKWKSRI